MAQQIRNRNSLCWKEAFKLLAKEIVDLTVYRDLLNEPRHHEFKEMTIHSIFGSFGCNCEWSWSSNKCNALFEYRYNKWQKRGEINLLKEFGQKCKKCEELCIYHQQP